MDIAQYLDRIQYSGLVTPTYETLRGLQAAHLCAVPFENLDIVPLHRPLRLDEQALWDKIVIRRRGGFCYELNGIYAWLLRRTGFQVTYLAARVFRRDASLGIDFDHLTLLVRMPGQTANWLSDVGFGDSFMEPLVLQEGEQPQGLRSYRLEKVAEGFALWQRGYDGSWERQYFFDLLARNFPDEYEAACTYHQKSPDSSFTRKSVVTRVTDEGRITLEPGKLIVTVRGLKHEKAIGPDEWPRLLWEHFGIKL